MYNKTEIDAMITGTTTDLTNYYDKSDTDALLLAKQGVISSKTDITCNTLTASNVYNKTYIQANYLTT